MMKGKDVKALGLPALVAIERSALVFSTHGKPIKAMAHEAGLQRPHVSAKDGVRITLEQEIDVYGVTLPVGHGRTIAAMHVVRAWTDEDEARLVELQRIETVSTALGVGAAAWGLIEHGGDLDVAVRHAVPGFDVTVDGDALVALLAVWTGTREAAHFTIARLAAAGDENAQAVIDAMDPIELLRFEDVARLVAPGVTSASGARGKSVHEAIASATDAQALG